jgi:multidrug efflux pump subunit AcrA (membrane-fusion protein)
MSTSSDPRLEAADESLNPGGDEGGLRAPPGLTGWRKAWWWFHLLVLVNLARLRFIGILLVIGVIITQWDQLVAYYDSWTRPSETAAASAADVEYFCPMHPTVVRDNPKEKCPICFMPLSKRSKGTSIAEALPAGVVSRVQLTPYRVVLAGVQTWPVDYIPLTKDVTAVGFVEFNERGQRTVSARVAGRIDKLVANETGQMVNAGDELASLYSPELLVTVQNLLDAKRSGNNDYLANARTRLQLLGIDDPQIDEILAANSATTQLRIRSPINGHVITKYVREGQYVEEGTPLYDVADLSTVWIQAQIYEDDLAFLPVDLINDPHAHDWSGLTVTATTRAFPDQPIEGKLAFIYPHVDEATRTVTVRFELENPGHKLRPGATATVTLKVNPSDVSALSAVAISDSHASEMLQQGRVLAVPESAVIDTGSQRIVYREASPGVYEGTDVAVGPAMSGPGGAIFYPVLRGLSHGNLVVASGSFLVDAETRLNPAAGSIYFGGSSGSQSSRPNLTTVRPSTPDDPDAKIAAALAKLSPADRELAQQQAYCPILANSRLGGMGTPIKLTIEGQTVFICCSGCREKALADPKATLSRVEELKAAKRSGDALAMTAERSARIAAALSGLSEADRRGAEAQRYCAFAQKSLLGSMGTPVKLVIDEQPVFLCCEGCRVAALKNPKQTLANAAKLQAANRSQK